MCWQAQPICAATGDLAGAISAGERALSHLADQHELEATLNARLMLARSLYAAGRYDDAIRRAREVVALLGEDVERGAVPGANQTVSARAWLAICHAELGSFAAGASEGELAMRLASQPRCSEHDVVWSRVSLGRLQVVSGECRAAIESHHHAPEPFRFESSLADGVLEIVDTSEGERLRLIVGKHHHGLTAAVRFGRPGGEIKSVPLLLLNSDHHCFQSSVAPAELHEFSAELHLMRNGQTDVLPFRMVEPA